MLKGTLDIKGDLRPKSVAGTVRYVGANCAYTTIQSAITASSAGDTILVAPGTYTEAITYSVDNLTIKAIGSYVDTIITQAAATTVDFSTMSNCVLEGFTVSVTAADGDADYTLYGNNDGTTSDTANIIKSCKLVHTSTADISQNICAEILDGYWEFRDCKIVVSNTNASGGQCFFMESYSGTPDGIKVYNCDFDIDNSETGSALGDFCFQIKTGTLDIWNSKIDIQSANTSTSENAAILNYSTGTINIYNSSVRVVSSGSASTYGIAWLGAAASICNSYNNSINSDNSDGDEKWINIGATATFNSYGDTVISGVSSGAGTINLYNTPKAGDVGYQCVSSGTTGGSGSAASGKNYVNVVINGTTRKLFYDTAA